MEGKDAIKELFSQKLGNHEVPVNPELWSTIASQIPTVTSTATAAASGVSLTTKILIGISVAASLTAGIYFLQTEDKNPTEKSIPNKTLPTEVKQKVNSERIIEISTSAIKSDNQPPSIQPKEIVKNESLNEIESIKSVISSEPDQTLTVESGIVQPNSFTEIKTINEVANPENNVQEVAKVNETKGNLPSSTSNSITSNNSSALPRESAIQLTLPNVFTPNGDGVNDYLELKIEGVSEFSVVVLNDNGKVVYQSQEQDFKWDGSLPNGDKASQGSYVYYITGKDSEGKLVTKHSRLTIKF